MKRLRYLVAVSLVLSMSLTAQTYAQTSSKISQSLPPAPVTYSGDTKETISRRAQWIEGAKKEGALVWWFNLNPKEANKIIAEFNKIYPFITVKYWRGQDKERDATTEAEHTAGRLSVDINTIGSEVNYPRWRKMGIIEKYTEIIPGIKNMDKGIYSKFGDWAIPGNNAIAPQYNTNLVPAAQAPKTWEDLLDPKWKGQIGLTPDIKVWYVLALAEGGWGVEKTEDFLRKLRQQQLIWATGHSGGHNLLIAGEFKIFGEGYWFHVNLSQKKAAPVDWVRVRPVVITGPSITLMKKGPHPNAARLFIEWLFSPSGLATYERVSGYGAAFPGAGTQLSKALQGLPLVYRTEELQLKVIETGFNNRIAQLLGVTPE